MLALKTQKQVFIQRSVCDASFIKNQYVLLIFTDSFCIYCIYTVQPLNELLEGIHKYCEEVALPKLVGISILVLHFNAVHSIPESAEI